MTCGQKFLVCKHCGNLIGLIHDAGVPMVCCGEPMSELVANTVDASREKHVPVVKREGDFLTVQVGSEIHPSTEEHHIVYVYLEESDGGQRKCVKVGSDPIVKFSVTGEKNIAVYAYCNLHGLWKTEL